MLESILALIIPLIVIGLVLYLVTLLPIDERIKTAINAIVIVVVIIWLLRIVFGML